MITVENKSEFKRDANGFLHSLKIGDWFVLEWQAQSYVYHVLDKRTFNDRSCALDLLFTNDRGSWAKVTYKVPITFSSLIAIKDFYRVTVPNLNVIRK